MDVNSLLAAVTFVPSPGYGADVTLTARVDDGESVPTMGTISIGAAQPGVDARTGGGLPGPNYPDAAGFAPGPIGVAIGEQAPPPVSESPENGTNTEPQTAPDEAMEFTLTVESPGMEPLPINRIPGSGIAASLTNDAGQSARHAADSGASRIAVVPAWMTAELPEFAAFPANPPSQLRNSSALAQGGSNADARGAALARDLDELRENVRQGTTIEKYALSSAVAVSSGLSVGYVAWLVRGGALLSTLLSSMPAWRVLDPFPVLARQRESDEDDDDDSLESMVSDDGTADEPPGPDDRDGAGNAAPGR
jgi:hypothetical protein